MAALGTLLAILLHSMAVLLGQVLKLKLHLLVLVILWQHILGCLAGQDGQTVKLLHNPIRQDQAQHLFLQ